MATTGIIILAHGSKSKEGIANFISLLKKLPSLDNKKVKYAFFEFSEPSLDSIAQELINEGHTRIHIIPFFLFTGKHLHSDIPQIMQQIALSNPGISISMDKPIGICHETISMATKHTRETMQKLADSNNKNTIFIGVGVGSSIADSNADIAKFTKIIADKVGLSISFAAYVNKHTSPSIEEILEITNFLPHKYIIILPIMFFNGIYTSRLGATIDNPKFKDKNISLTPTLSDNAYLARALSLRIMNAPQ